MSDIVLMNCEDLNPGKDTIDFLIVCVLCSFEILNMKRIFHHEFVEYEH